MHIALQEWEKLGVAGREERPSEREDYSREVIYSCGDSSSTTRLLESGWSSAPGALVGWCSVVWEDVQQEGWEQGCVHDTRQCPWSAKLCL